MGDSFLNNINRLQNDFYDGNKKNWLFKKAQKMECAAKIANEIPIEELFKRTVYIIPNTNRVFFDYTIFKLYATPDTYEHIINRFMESFQWCIDNYGGYEAHLNLDSFTISACERHKGAIEIYYNKCLNSKTAFAAKMSKMYIYSTPSAIDTITKMLSLFIEPGVRNNMVLYDKKESPAILNVVLGGEP